MMTAASFALCASGAIAGGIERSTQSALVLFEKSNYAELSFSHVSPSVSGSASAALGGFSSGNMAESYSQIGFAYKHQINDRLSAAIIYDTPYGANVNYPVTAGNLYFNRGANAEINSNSITALLKYTTASNFSVFGGLRYQTMSANAVVPALSSYRINTNKDSGTGFVLGAAWEKPEIALRVALTYNSKIKHSVMSTETTAAFGTTTTPTRYETPESLNLEFQSGVSANTLVFGSIRWVGWSHFNLRPSMYAHPAFGGESIVSYANDVTTYNIGVGRKFNDTWSAALTLGYEKSNGGFSANLGPTDGNLSIGLGGSYTKGKMKITAGVRYIDIGNASTTLASLPPGTTAATFTGNSAVAVGFKIGFSF